MKEIRGIIIDFPEGKKRVRILSRDVDGEDHKIHEFPRNKKITRKILKAFLARVYNLKPEKIRIPKHILLRLKD